MANTLTQVGIETGNIVEAYHVTQSIDAFTGADAYDITLSGSFTLQNGTQGSDKIAISDANGKISFTNNITASLQGTSSYATTTLSSSYALTASYVPNAFIQNGNSFGTTARLGTNDSQPLIFETNNSQRINISSTGVVGIGDGNNGTLFNILNAICATSGSENRDLLTLSTSAGLAYTIHAHVVGWGGIQGKIGGEVIGVFQNLGGTLTSAGSPIVNKIEDFSGSPTFTLTTSGTDIILQVTGQAATAISWAGHLKFISYDSNS